MGLDIPKEKVPGKRISKQLCRVAAIFEVLMELDEASVAVLHEIVVDVLPERVCERTIRRDLDALLAVGFVGCRDVKLARKNLPYKFARIWHLSSPAVLRDRIGAHKRAIERKAKEGRSDE